MESQFVIVDSYKEYNTLLSNKFNGHLLYKGDFILRCVRSCIKEGSHLWILWDSGKTLECCYAERHGETYAITKIVDFSDFDAEKFNMYNTIDDNRCLTWLNMCHYKDLEGIIHYDSFYDSFPLGDDVVKNKITIGQLRETINTLLVSRLPFTMGDTVMLCGRLSEYNILNDMLQRAGFHVIANIIDSQEIPDANEEQLCCENFGLNLYAVTPQGTVVVRMPRSREIVVSETNENVILKRAHLNLKLLRTESDSLGNIWLLSTDLRGKTESIRHTYSSINYVGLNS